MPSTRVLVADDAPHLALYLQHMLRKAGYEARVVSRAEQVQAAIAEHKPAALLLNVEMNGRSGLDICRAIRADGHDAGLVIVFVTGRIFESEEKLIAASGANGFLLKPVSLGALVGKLNELGLSPDMSKVGSRESGSGPFLPFADAEALTTLERLKIELTLAFAPLAEPLRVGAFLTAPHQRGWLARPDGCVWPDPDVVPVASRRAESETETSRQDGGAPGVETGRRDAGGTEAVKFEEMNIAREEVAIDGEPLCQVYLCSDAAAPTPLAPAIALLKQVQRVVELSKQREELFEELGLDHECLNSIYEISSDGQSVNQPEQAFDKIAKRTARAMSVSGPVRMIMWIQSEQTGLLEPVRGHRVEKPQPRKPNYGLVGKCFYEERAQL